MISDSVRGWGSSMDSTDGTTHSSMDIEVLIGADCITRTTHRGIPTAGTTPGTPDGMAGTTGMTPGTMTTTLGDGILHTIMADITGVCLTIEDYTTIIVGESPTAEAQEHETTAWSDIASNRPLHITDTPRPRGAHSVEGRWQAVPSAALRLQVPLALTQVLLLL